MNINFVEVWTCRGSGYSNDGSVGLQEFRDLVTNWRQDEFSLEEALVGLGQILCHHENLEELLKDLEAGKVCTGNTKEGSWAMGFQPLEELAKAAKLQFAESMLGE